MEYLFAFGIPTINRYDLLQEALNKYKVSYPDIRIIIVDNGDQCIPDDIQNVIVYRPGRNIGVAASWNFICNTAFTLHNKRYVALLNDDIILGLDQDKLNEILLENDNHEEVGIINSEKQWSAFVLSRNTYNLVGDFDEKFYPAYFEDNDYEYRLKVSGIAILQDPRLNPEVYRQSMTSHKDQNINNGFMSNREYYMKKWGGLPGNEQYRTPFTPGIL